MQETLSTKNVEQKLDHAFKNLNRAVNVNLAFGFISKNIEEGKFLRTRKQNTAGLIKTSVHQDWLEKTKGYSQQTDVIESCSRERMNTRWRIYKFTNLTVLAALLKDVPMGSLIRYLTRTCAEKRQSTVSHLRRIQDSQRLTGCASFVFWLFICIEIKIWKEKHQKCSVCFSIEWLDSAFLSSKDCTGTIFQLLKTLCTRKFSIMK